MSACVLQWGCFWTLGASKTAQDGPWGHIWLTGPLLALNLEKGHAAEQTLLLVNKFKYSECSACSVWPGGR